MVEVVILDLDGTLIDTEPAIFSSFRYTFEKLLPKVDLTEEMIKSFIGPTLWDSFSRFSEDEELIEDLVNCYRKHNIPAQTKYVELFPNVVDTLEKLKNQGYKIAICTSKLRDSAEFGMNLCKIDKYFDYTICLDDIKSPKPNPEGINKIIEKFGTNKAIMVGDNISDVKAGNNANIPSVAVTYSHPKEKLETANPNYIISDISEIFDVLNKENR